jgi:PAS domain S-box-containing protein
MIPATVTALAHRDGTDVDFRHVLEILPAAAYTCDADGLITYFNQRAVATWGREPRLRDPADRYCGSFHLFAPDGAAIPHDDCLMARCLRERREYRDAEMVIERPDGSRVTTEANAAPLYDESGQLAGAVNVLVDIGYRRRAQQEIRDSRAALEAELADSRLLQQVSSTLIGEHSDEVLYERLVDAAARIMHSEFASMQMLTAERGHEGELRLLAHRGFSPESVRFWKWVGTDSSSSCSAALRERSRVFVRDVENCPFMADTDDLRMLRQTGIRAVQTTPLLSRSGTIVGMISTHWGAVHEPSERELRLLDIIARQAADVIEHRNAQEALRQREERLRAIFDSAAVGAAILLPDTRFIQVNNAFCAITGYAAEELRALDCRTLTHPDDRAEMQRLLDALLAGLTSSFVFEKRYFRKDGASIWVQNSVSLTRDASGAPLHIVVLCQDITERRCAEDALAESHARLREQADELVRFNRAAVGRELRMVELKSEINALCARLGEVPPYQLSFDQDGRPASA